MLRSNTGGGKSKKTAVGLVSLEPSERRWRMWSKDDVGGIARWKSNLDSNQSKSYSGQQNHPLTIMPSVTRVYGSMPVEALPINWSRISGSMWWRTWSQISREPNSPTALAGHPDWKQETQEKEDCGGRWGDWRRGSPQSLNPTDFSLSVQALCSLILSKETKMVFQATSLDDKPETLQGREAQARKEGTFLYDVHQMPGHFQEGLFRIRVTAGYNYTPKKNVSFGTDVKKTWSSRISLKAVLSIASLNPGSCLGSNYGGSRVSEIYPLVPPAPYRVLATAEVQSGSRVQGNE